MSMLLLGDILKFNEKCMNYLVDVYRFLTEQQICRLSAHILLLAVEQFKITSFCAKNTLFLFFLGIHIQSNSHDSTEDACTALRLYRRYRDLTDKDDSEFHGTLNRLYETGRSMNWQVED